ncbi:hypothetical protein HRbin04_00601 [archaeon HR04]|nr:hypothetical protein HRbin04_00601 [archaeon HR04]
MTKKEEKKEDQQRQKVMDIEYVVSEFKRLFRQDINKLIEELLILEKRRQGIEEDELVFLGTSNIANYYWCAMKSLLKSKDEERIFFEAYLVDRIRYSLKLGYINRIPENKKELLEVGKEITFNDIERLLEEKKMEVESSRINDRDGDTIAFIDDEHTSSKTDLLLRGMLVESLKAERYPTIRWNFKWGRYIVLGVPDGITDRFVYEFKSTKNTFLMHFIKPVADTQADLYGYFFRRAKKRVQLYMMKEDKINTWEDNVNQIRALETLQSFKEIDNGLKPKPPKEWKCRSCKYVHICPLRVTK